HELAQRLDRGGHMIEKCLVSFHQSEKSVGAERLHESLNTAEPENFSEIRRNTIRCGGAFRFVMNEQLFAFGPRDRDVGIEEKRRQIVFGKARPHALEIDQVRLAVADDNILRLKIAMNQDARAFAE